MKSCLKELVDVSPRLDGFHSTYLCVVSSSSRTVLDRYVYSGLNDSRIPPPSRGMNSERYSVTAHGWSPFPMIPYGRCGQRCFLNTQSKSSQCLSDRTTLPETSQFVREGGSPLLLLSSIDAHLPTGADLTNTQLRHRGFNYERSMEGESMETTPTGEKERSIETNVIVLFLP